MLKLDDSGRFPIFHLNEKCRIMPMSCDKSNNFKWLIITLKTEITVRKNSLLREEAFIVRVDLSGLKRTEEKAPLETALTPKGLKTLKKAVRSCLIDDLLPQHKIPILTKLLADIDFTPKPKRVRKPRRE